MPKERLHLLLAEEGLRLVKRRNLFNGLNKEAYLLGAILPDVFFYDLPHFKLGSVGNGLHRLEGEAAAEFFGAWLQEGRKQLVTDMKSWMLGFCTHLLADGLLHPLINDFCRLFSEDLHVSAKSCHHWLESELESHWLSAIGPQDGYLPLLEWFSRRGENVSKCLRYYRTFLLRAELTSVPSEAEIGRCLAWQSRLLRLFASHKWGTIRPRLLGWKWGEPLGVLLVPRRSVLCCCAREGVDTRCGNGFGIVSEPWLKSAAELCAARFMAQTIASLANRLSELAEHF